MIRTLMHAWNDPVTRWEFRFLESQHRKPRRWWMALVALPGITAAVLFARYLDPESSRDGSVISYGLISAMLLAYMIGAWVAVSLSAAALAKRDPSVMGEHLILTGVTARRLAFARVIALWRHHRRLWLLLLVLRGALAYGTMVTLIWYPFSLPPSSIHIFFYNLRGPSAHSVSVPLDPDCASLICYLEGWLRKGDWRIWYPTPPATAAAAPAALLILSAADSLLLCAGAALISRVFYRLPALVIPVVPASRLLIAVLAFGVMESSPRALLELNAALDRALAAAGTSIQSRHVTFHDSLGHVVLEGYAVLAKAPPALASIRRVLYHTLDENNYEAYYYSFWRYTYTQRVILDGMQLSASGLIDGAYPIANMIRPEDSARYVVFAMFTVAGSAVLYLILIGAYMRIAGWIVRRRGALR